MNTSHLTAFLLCKAMSDASAYNSAMAKVTKSSSAKALHERHAVIFGDEAKRLQKNMNKLRR